MKALVTGGTGFIGGYIVEALLDRGYEVRALVRSTSDLTHLRTTTAEIVTGDLSDYESLLPAVEGMDIVFHAAARVLPGWGSWQDYELSIVKGTENLLEASVQAAIQRFLHVSTGTVYGIACHDG